jgi:pantoate--beta-alanine ligase
MRDSDGLALSSRNVFLSEGDRAAALSISQGLFAAAEAAAGGERTAEALQDVVGESLAEAGIEQEYVTLADALEATPIERLDREAFLAVAAPVGAVRLIDNVFLSPDGSSDTGTRLDTPSTLGRS